MTSEKLAKLVPLLAALVSLSAHAHGTDQPFAIELKGSGVDLTRLPLGDGKLSKEPRKGWIWPCHTDPEAGGAFRNGPWIRDDGTYDFAHKVQVSGEEHWPHLFRMSVGEGQRVFTTNDLPDHATGKFPISPTDPAYQYDRNPNRIQKQSMTVVLPLEPKLASVPSCAPGAVGILNSGVALFSALDGPGRDAVAHETQDHCQGHPQQSGAYHYHNITTCIEDRREPGGHSQLVGYALDGFGIFGHYGEGGKMLTSADLDECHGHTHEIMWNGKRVKMYHYHATWDFPYTIGCMRGTFNMRDVMIVSGGPLHRPTNADARLGGPPPFGGPGGHGPPDLGAAASKLGISVETLRRALGPPPPNLGAASQRLGISEDALRDALGPPPSP